MNPTLSLPTLSHEINPESSGPALSLLLAETPTTASIEAEFPVVAATPSRSWQPLRWSCLLSGFLLTLGGTTAVVIGLVIAQFYPATTAQPPLTEAMIRRTEELVQRSRRFARLWVQTDGLRRDPIAALSFRPPQPLASRPRPAAPDHSRENMVAELGAIQLELQALHDRAASLERQMGRPLSPASLESRLAAMKTQLHTPAVLAEPVSDRPAEPTTAAPVAPDQPQLHITLPLDALFVDSQSRLQSQNLPLLENIVADLQNYPNALVRIAIHTDDLGDASQNQELSLRQAQTLQHYLANRLGNTYRWLALGYGGSEPLTPNLTNDDRQRNRRVEIIVESSR